MAPALTKKSGPRYGCNAATAGGKVHPILGTQKKRPPNRGGPATSTIPGQVPGGLFIIGDDFLMLSASTMAHTRSAIHCNLALVGVGSSSLDPAFPFL
jgi:hypothetical protein